jgi:hypothetical protein
MSPAVKNGILLVVVVLLLGGAVMMFTGGKGGENALPDQGSYTTWIDVKTKEIYRLSAAEADEWTNSNRRWLEPDCPHRLTVFKNLDTGEFTIVRAGKDKGTGEYYPMYDPATGEGLPSPSDRQMMNR